MHSGKVPYLVVENQKTINEGKVPFTVSAIERLIKEEQADKVVITGNYQWGLSIAYYLQEKGVEIRYLGQPQKQRGKKMEGIKYLKEALEKGLRGRPFFKKGVEEASHPWVALAKKYFRIKDDQRRVKHRIQNELRVILPEIFIGKPQKVFSKKGRKLLREKDYWSLLELCDVSVSALFQEFLPENEKKEREKQIINLLNDLSELEEKEKKLRREIIEITEGQCITELFNGNFSARLLILQIGWRKWKKFEHLRSYVGLSLTRVDSKGRLRISRVRPEIRTVLYFLLKTNVAKEIISEKMRKLKREKVRLPKRMEWLLEYIWKNCFAS